MSAHKITSYKCPYCGFDRASSDPTLVPTRGSIGESGSGGLAVEVNRS